MGKRAKPEEIIAKLREVEVGLSQVETAHWPLDQLALQSRPITVGGKSMTV
jgi:hypothetical protein